MCVDIKECDSNPCESNSVCKDTPGSYTCSCPKGYTNIGTVGEQKCVNINECSPYTQQYTTGNTFSVQTHGNVVAKNIFVKTL